MSLQRLRPPSWRANRRHLAEKEYAAFDGVLQIVGAKDEKTAPHSTLLSAARKKRGGESPPQATIAGGCLIVRLQWKENISVFEQLEELRKALLPVADCSKLAADVRLSSAARLTVYAALVAAARLPGDSRPVCRWSFFGCDTKTANNASITAEANTLSRTLCRLPPNVLTVPAFAKIAAAEARKHKVKSEIINAAKLKKMGAGAILAVGRASETPPCIVRLRYNGGGKKRVALIGKGVCYDTGGVNAKPARYMRGMKKDMAGAAVVLSAVLGAAKLNLPVNIDAYLALADNAVGANAYRPDEEIRSLSGKTIEVVHSDAEGRMILADTLTLMSRQKPSVDVALSFATLTGTMHVALGERMSGVFATNEVWQQKAFVASDKSGERLCSFPLAEDYRAALKSDCADIKQCAEEGEADHILAALFLREFMDKQTPWLHLDLSAVSCKGGLGAAPGPETGFGAAWTLAFLES